MGILNLTPDSFSDGGLFLDPVDPSLAVERGLALLAEGADLLDLGAESTRPGGGVYGAGARTVPVDEELERLLPVLAGLRRATDAPLSVDTRKGEVARQALAAGADLVNDVSALSDPDLGRAVADAGCPLVLMHSRGDIATMQREIRFTDLLAEVRAELQAAVLRAVALGVDPGQLVLDPGIGFGKTAAQNLLLVRRLSAFAELGRPLLLGASRKSFLGHVGPVEQAGVGAAPPDRRLGGSLAAAGWAAQNGAALVRVHDVADTVQFLAAWEAIATSATGATGPGDRGR
ncbi:MAG: dihydropteroate synthase [Acidobacteriota bacterium]|jgi:dihydropteroate synthase|nr:dihydropteroate synthase [Acidobacteriota bacterium]